MLAQLKTIVLIKQAKQLSFFRLVVYLEYQHFGVRLQAQNGQKQRLSSETHQSISVLRIEGYSLQEIAKKQDLVQRGVLLPSQNSANCL